MQQLLLKEALRTADIKFHQKEAKIFQHYMQGNDFSEMERELSMDLKQIKSALRSSEI